MAQKRSELLSVLGTMFEISKALTDAVLERGGGDEDLKKILKDRSLAGKIAALIVGAPAAVGNVFKVIVDYSLSFSDMIKIGKYGYVNSDITEKHFLLPTIPAGFPNKSEVDVELVHFNKFINSDDVIAELKRQGFRPATLWELLSFGATYPEKQREFPIVALGSVWRRWGGDRRVPYLWSGTGGRSLDLPWFEGGWRGPCRFVAVRESLPAGRQA